MNAKLLRAKMVENDFTVEKLSQVIGVTPLTVRLKLRGDGFKVSEARAIKNALGLTRDETIDIFFA